VLKRNDKMIDNNMNSELKNTPPMHNSINKTELTKLISFDLDNTLYDNREVIINAERVSSKFLTEAFAKQGKSFNVDDFLQIRNQLASSNQPQYENMSYLRQQALAQYCQPLTGGSEIAEQAFEVFLQARSKAIIEPCVLNMLEQLATKYILVSITNGNCDAFQLPLATYFQQHYTASSNQSQQHVYRAKPHPQMLEQTMIDFNLKPENILHVGDSIKADQQAAENAGMKFYYFAPFAEGVNLAEQCEVFLELFLQG
jgi:FMN hydrolase / 5-amino-6-(5-phospho-D-ribitylamino)uracil phosphatase